MRAYEARLAYFYTYFIEGAKEHAKAGRYGAAVIGVLDAAYVFPLRLVVGAIAPKPVGSTRPC